MSPILGVRCAALAVRALTPAYARAPLRLPLSRTRERGAGGNGLFGMHNVSQELV
jgi:hypothetical protein